MTETDLIEGCLANDRNSQKAVFDKYADKMLAVCHRYARYGAEAEDILQEGFIRVYTKMHLFRNEGSFEGWVRRIMIRTALRYTTNRYGLTDELDSNKPIDSQYTPISAEVSLNMETLEGMIKNLPDGYKWVFTLYVIEGYSHNEIADLLGITANTSRSQLAKARKQLQAMVLSAEKKMIDESGISTY